VVLTVAVLQRVLIHDAAVHQVAWRELDKGRARRTFAYSTTFFDVFGRNRKADIEDHQTIELQDESLYVFSRPPPISTNRNLFLPDAT
jgi:hypothetical protein